MRNRKSRRPLPEKYHFPSDLLNEVLLRLPPKTLLRFRCVCKSWRSLIDSSDFISMHLNCAKTKLLVVEKVPKTCTDTIFTIRRSDNTFRKITQLVEYSKFYMVYRSCMVNGLMLMDNTGDKELRLWNPSIRKSLLLPCCPFKYDFFNVRCLLGFSPSANDYKVVFIKLVDTTAFAVGIAVYSLCDHAWKVRHNWFTVPSWCFDQLDYRNSGAVFAQGVVYWRPFYCKRPGESTQLFGFNFDDEEFSFDPLPAMDNGMFRFIFVLGGSLAVLGISKMQSSIWVMKKNGGTELWCHYWKGDTNSDVYKFISTYSYNDFVILYIEHTGKLLIQSFKKLMVYDIGSNQTQWLGNSVRLRYVETYVESLVLHKGYSNVTLNSHGSEDDTKLGDSK